MKYCNRLIELIFGKLFRGTRVGWISNEERGGRKRIKGKRNGGIEERKRRANERLRIEFDRGKTITESLSFLESRRNYKQKQYRDTKTLRSRRYTTERLLAKKEGGKVKPIKERRRTVERLRKKN